MLVPQSDGRSIRAMRTKKLLLTTDLSSESLRAVDDVREMADGRALAVTLLHVVPVVAVAPPGGPRAPVMRPTDLAGEVEKARVSLGELAKKLTGLEVAVDVISAQDVAGAIWSSPMA